MQTLLYILAGLSGIMGFFVLVSASKYNFTQLGLTLGGLSYLAAGLLSLNLSTWWPLLVGWFLAFVFRKLFGDPTAD